MYTYQVGRFGFGWKLSIGCLCITRLAFIFLSLRVFGVAWRSVLSLHSGELRKVKFFFLENKRSWIKMVEYVLLGWLVMENENEPAQ